MTDTVVEIIEEVSEVSIISETPSIEILEDASPEIEIIEEISTIDAIEEVSTVDISETPPAIIEIVQEGVEGCDLLLCTRRTYSSVEDLSVPLDRVLQLHSPIMDGELYLDGEGYIL